MNIIKIQNSHNKIFFGVGYLGAGKFNNKNFPKIYYTWKSMLERCYSEKYQEKHVAYKGCSVNKNWYNFQNFGKWYEKNYIEGFALDKDILIKGNKIYSSRTCTFVPTIINNLFTNRKNHRGILPVGVTKVGIKYHSALRKGGSKVHLGTFDTVEEAFLAYKTAKEQYIKEVANIWKPIIKPNVYCAMYTYQVEITD